VALLAFALSTWSPSASAATEKPVRIVAFGDSLTAGLGLPAADAFPVKLKAALRAKGYAVEIVDAGVSGDTATGGLARLEWSVAAGTDAVIVELGANDALRGIPVEETRAALDAIVRKLKARGIAVLLAGMRAPPNLGDIYVKAFESMYDDVAKQHDVPLYPFFLDGVAADRALNQPDGMHPNAAGVARVVEGILPSVEALIARVRSRAP
jgi:acyl-CoA thioesterase-1